jgi:hypothetical protein
MDSAAYHFRHGFDDMNQRSRAMDKLIQSLQRIALEHKVAVSL